MFVLLLLSSPIDWKFGTSLLLLRIEIVNFTLFEQLVREDHLQLRQEAIDLQEYSSAKLDRVTRYLGVLADKTRKLGNVCPFVSAFYVGFELD